MKPNFALGLTDDGITLWQRDDDAWWRVGAVAMDAPDMDDQMTKLVTTAKSNAPDGVVTKLVIPDDQILYTRLPAGTGPDAIRKGLQGKTPYPVEELDFDFVTDSDGVHVAVVARETLIEAEEFAKDQGLNPVCFVAAPVGQAFVQEPFFSRVRGVDPSADLERGGPILVERGDLASRPVPDAKPTAPSQTIPAKAAKPAAPKDTGPTPDTSDDATVKRAGMLATKPETPAVKTGFSGARSDAAPKKPRTKDRGKAAPEASKPPAQEAKPAASSASTADNGSESVSFRSRRSVAPGSKVAGDTSGPAPHPAKPSKALSALSKSRSLSLSSLGGAALAERLRSSVTAPVSRASGLLGSLTSKPAAANPAPVAPPKKARPANSPAPTVPKQTPAAKPDAAQAATRKPDADPEAERLTVFGARRNTTTPEKKLPQRALAISGAALLLVLAVVVWVFYFTRASEPDLAQPILPAESVGEIAAPDALALSDAEEASPEAEEAADVEAALGLSDAAQQQGTQLAPEAGSATPEGVTSDGATPSVAAPTQEAGRLAALRSVRAIAPEGRGTLPDVQAAPAPFGTNPLPPLRGADSDPVGPAEAPEVAQSTLPLGEEALDIVVTQGAPAATPPVRPEGIAPTPPPEPEPAAEAPAPLDESALQIDVTGGTPPAIPPDRPEGIAPEPPEVPDTPAEQPGDAAQDEDQASLTPPPGGVSLDMLTPAPRPAAIVEQAEARAEQFASATPQAVAASLRPSDRPNSFSQTVQRALAAARTRQAATPEPEVVQASAASVAPRIPSSASVTRAATQTRAINLRQINLLGVMGTPSARRALVRLDNGRVVTVQVGERLDGGQVTAIGDTELRYNKRGRDVVLRIAS